MKQSFDLRKGVDFIGVTCAFYCHDSRGNILMHKRSKQCRDEQGRWDGGGGSMEFGETFEGTVRREIREEYGIAVKKLEQVGAFNVLRKNGGKDTHWVKVLFVALVSPKGARIGEPEKMDEIGWFPADKLPKPLHSNTRKDMAVLKQLGVTFGL